MSQTITIVLNGSERDCPAGRTIAALLADLVLKPEHVAVERNQDLVPRSRFAETPLLPGDVIEIVTLVGGG